MSQFRIELSGVFRALRDNQAVAPLPSRRCEELLTYLLLSPKDQHPRTALAGFFWPDQTDERAAALLRQNLYLLQNWLSDELQCPTLIDVQRQVILVDRSAAIIDVLEFERTYDAAMNHPHRRLASCRPCLEQLSAVLPSTSGSPLDRTSRRAADGYLSWLEQRFSTVQRAISLVLAARYQAAERSGEQNDAVQAARRWLEHDPWHEPAQRALISSLAHAGQRIEALRQFAQSRALLKEELDLDVEPATLLLVERIRNNQPVNRDSLPTVPISMPRLFGRTEELAALRTLLSHRDQRLISIVGIGGAGKTVLARAAAAEHQADFADGAVFVALEHTTDRETMLRRISSDLGLRPDVGSDLLAQLIRFLADREVLIVLDNLEQITEAAAVINRLTEETGQTVFLVTTRRPLQLRRETLLRLDGLRSSVDTTDNDAVRLFLARAEQYDRHRDWSSELAAISAICRLCGGLPLAIELAAYQARYRTCAEIADAFTQRISLFKADLHDLPSRQRDMQMVLRTSWDFLPAAEQPLLSSLSLFRAPFSPTAARAVIGVLSNQHSDQLLQRMIDLGLLRQTARHELAVHPIVQQFLETEAARDVDCFTAARRSYARYHLQLLTDAGLAVINAQSRSWARTHAALRADVLHAWNQAAELGEEAALLQAAVPLMIFGAAGDWAILVDDCFATTLARPDPALSSGFRHRILGLRAYLMLEHQDARRVTDVLNELLTEPLPPLLSAEQALALRIRARLALTAGDLQQIPAWLERSRQFTPDPALPFVQPEPDALYGRYLLAVGDLAQAEVRLNNELATSRRIADQRSEIGVLNELALLPARRGDYARSLLLLEETVTLARHVGDTVALSALLANLGNARQLAGGDPDRALSELAESAETARSIDNPGYLRIALSGLARLTFLQGRYNVAVTYIRQKLQLDCELGFQPSTGELLVQYVEALSLLGRVTPIGPLLQFIADLPDLPAPLRARAAEVHLTVLERPMPDVNPIADTSAATLRPLL